MANISDFVSKLKNGGARPTLFEVTVQLKGENASSATGDASDQFKYLCKGVEIPASNLGFATLNYFGRQIKYPGNRTFDDFTTVVINDEGYTIRNKIENWLEKLNSHSTNLRDASFISKTNYICDMTVQTYKKTGEVDQQYVFKNCFPTSLEPIDLSWDQTDVIMEFSVTWSYDYWTHTQSAVI